VIATDSCRPARYTAFLLAATGRLLGYLPNGAGPALQATRKPAMPWRWCVSVSVPIGSYAVHPASIPKIIDLVALRPADALTIFRDERRYLPQGRVKLVGLHAVVRCQAPAVASGVISPACFVPPMILRPILFAAS
jgi:type IV secretory pathway protease TraF